MEQLENEMTAADVLWFAGIMCEHQIDFVIDGGWGVDALLGRQTRRHDDLDVAIQLKDSILLRETLQHFGFTEIPRDDSWECNFVLGDKKGRLVDVHSYTFYEDGRKSFGVDYPPESLTGNGKIAGVEVRCIRADWMVKFHTGYPLDLNDYRDVKALCDQFGITLPDQFLLFENC